MPDLGAKHHPGWFMRYWNSKPRRDGDAKKLIDTPPMRETREPGNRPVCRTKRQNWRVQEGQRGSKPFTTSSSTEARWRIPGRSSSYGANMGPGSGSRTFHIPRRTILTP
jgi:hypothetical protein